MERVFSIRMQNYTKMGINNYLGDFLSLLGE